MKNIINKSITSINILIIAAILVAIYMVSYHIHTRKDLTDSKIYTTSESTRTILKDLDDVVNIDVYFSKKLPVQMNQAVSEIKDTLDEYKIIGGSNIYLHYYDPDADKETEQKLMMLGIPKAQFTVHEKDEAAVMAGFMGIAVSYGDKNEAIPFVQNISTLEYDLTSAIIKVTQDKKKKVAFAYTESEKASPEERFSYLEEYMEKQYTFEWVNLSDEKTDLLNANYDSIIIYSPENLSEQQKYAIDQTVMKGTNCMFILDPVKMSQKGLTATPSENGLDQMIQSWGIQMPKELLVDESAVNAPFSNGRMQYFVKYPYWVKTHPEFCDKDNPSMKNIQAMLYPWTGYIKAEAIQKGLSFKPLVNSTKYSKSVGEPYNLEPKYAQKVLKNSDPAKSETIAGILSGVFPSYYADKTAPENKADAGQTKWTKLNQSPEETKVILYANAQFLEPHIMQSSNSNAILLINLIDQVTMGDALSSIRSKGIITRPLEIQEDKDSTGLIKLINIFGSTLILCIIGVLLAFSRKHILEKKARMYQSHS